MEVEKRSSKGGFLQLFDWNVKSRKKLFSNNKPDVPGKIGQQTESALVIERANGHRRVFSTLRELLNVLTRDEIFKVYELMQGYYLHIPPADLGKKFQDDMMLMMEEGQDIINAPWNGQSTWVIQRWRLFMDSGVHVLELRSGDIIYMLAGQIYPLTLETLNMMLPTGLGILDNEANDETAVNFIMWIHKWILDLNDAQEKK